MLLLFIVHVAVSELVSEWCVILSSTYPNLNLTLFQGSGRGLLSDVQR